jgi:hypothetical protein
MRIGLMSGANLGIVALVLALSGCGGGADVTVVVPVTPAGPDFDVVARINGEPIAHLDVLPGESETISVVSGDAFELDTSGPVYWDFSAGGSADIPAVTGGAILYGGATLHETVVNGSQLVLSVTSSAPPGSSVPVTIYVTSQDDSSQVATIDLLVEN